MGDGTSRPLNSGDHEAGTVAPRPSGRIPARFSGVTRLVVAHSSDYRDRSVTRGRGPAYRIKRLIGIRRSEAWSRAVSVGVSARTPPLSRRKSQRCEEHPVGDATGFETQLADLTGLTIEEVKGLRRDKLAPFLETALRQVERPRVNLGGSGPPGRAD